MQFEDIKGAVKEIGFETKRADSDDYLEVVIIKKDLAELVLKLNSIFGPVACTAASVLTPRAKETIREFGGLIAGQTLYFYEQDGCFIFAMLWPWGDGEHITLKLARK